MSAAHAAPTETADATEALEAAAAAEASPDEARLLTHAYDGIHEYDNPMPGWWTSAFIGTVVFAALYGLYFHVVDWGKTPDQTYQAALGDYEGQRDQRERAEAANISEDTIARATEDPKVLERGAAMFASRCASCHAEDGRGLIGPNLTDKHQLHGVTRMDLYGTISKGVPTTAMMAWGDQLPQTDVLAVTAFVATLRGKDVAGGKAPQGARVEKFQ